MWERLLVKTWMPSHTYFTSTI